MTKPEGRHAEIVPMDGSHYVLVDGREWSRHDCLATAEAVRAAIVERWAQYYDCQIYSDVTGMTWCDYVAEAYSRPIYEEE